MTFIAANSSCSDGRGEVATSTAIAKATATATATGQLRRPVMMTTKVTSIGNASHGSFGLQPQQPHTTTTAATTRTTTTAAAAKPAIELVHHPTTSTVGTTSTTGIRRSHSTSKAGTKGMAVDYDSDENPILNDYTNNIDTKTTTTTTTDSEGTGAAPSSVHVMLRNSSTSSKPYALTRVDVSDLSGSYYNGTTGRTTTAVISTTAAATQQQWKHAHVLSSKRLPQHPQPHYIDADDNSYGGGGGRNGLYNTDGSSQPRSTGSNALRNWNLLRTNNNNNNNGKGQQQQQQQLTSSITPSVAMDRSGDSIEVSIQQILPTTLTSSSATNHTISTHQQVILEKKKTNQRIPLILLLMDPQRKLYELVQIWIDTTIDTVRDILQTINKNIAQNTTSSSSNNNHVIWKQDYDGIFHIRNNHFTQLIHILPAGKYDIIPSEIWICKPWSMSSKQTVQYASTCLNHLKSLSILQYRKCNHNNGYGSKWKQIMGPFRNNNNGGGGSSHSTMNVNNTSNTGSNSNNDYTLAALSSSSSSAIHTTSISNNGNNNNSNDHHDMVLVLSKKATQRLYVPGGIFKHHHACQFLAFVPPFETYIEQQDQSIIPTPTIQPNTIDCSQSTSSGLSDSNYNNDDDRNDDEDSIMDLLDDNCDDDDDDDDDNNNGHETDTENYYSDPELVLDSETSSSFISSPIQQQQQRKSQLDMNYPPSFHLAHNRSICDGDGGGATVVSTKTKESTYIFRTNRSPYDGTGPAGTAMYGNGSQPIPHVMPNNNFGNSDYTFNERSSSSSSLSSFQRLLRRIYSSLFTCRQQSALNRRSRSYDDYCYHQKQNSRKSSSNTTTSTLRTTILLSDDASMITTNHNNNGNHPYTFQKLQYEDVQPTRNHDANFDTSSHCSGIPLLLTSSTRTADWNTPV